MRNYMNIMLEALIKKSALLDSLYELACEQERCLGLQGKTGGDAVQAGTTAGAGNEDTTNAGNGAATYTISRSNATTGGSTNFDIEKIRELAKKRKEVVSEIEKIDDGFVSVYERVSGELQKQPSEYADIIKSIQKQIQIIMDKTNKIKVKDIRIADALGTGASRGTNAGSTGGYAAKNVTGKYSAVMKNSGVGKNDKSSLGSTFIDQKN